MPSEHPYPSKKEYEKFQDKSHGLPCPCCSEPCDREEADVGVGVIYGPWGCMCGWSEDSTYDNRNSECRTDDGYLLDQYGFLYPGDKKDAE